MVRLIYMAFMASAVLICAGCNKQPDPESFLEHYTKLHRSGNIEGLLELHTADSEFLLPGREPIRGTAALRDLFEWDAELGSELVMSGIHAIGDTIIIDSIIERNRFFRALGIDEVRYKPGSRFILRDGRIAGTYAADFDEESLRRLTENFQVVLKWVREHRSNALEQLLPGGKFRQDAASARLWLEVLADWKKKKQASR